MSTKSKTADTIHTTFVKEDFKKSEQGHGAEHQLADVIKLPHH
jgi:hypothetical protein